jgi:hypothetical protein
MRPIARYGFLGNVRKLLSQAAFFIDAKESGMGQTATNLGTAGSVLDAQYGSTTGADTNDPLLLEHDGTNYVYFPGVVGNTASTPAVAYNLTGDVEIIVQTIGIDWSSSARGTIVSSWPTGFLFDRFNATSLLFGTSLGGGNNYVVCNHGLSGVTDQWFRLRYNRTAGTVEIASSVNGSTWATLSGTTITTSPGVDFPNFVNLLKVGGEAAGLMPCRVPFFELRDGYGGTAVVRYRESDITNWANGALTSFVSSTGETWTINRSTSGRKSVAVVRDVWLFGTDDFMEVADNDLLDFGASDSFTVVAVARVWGSNDGALVAKKTSGALGAGWWTRRVSATSYQFLVDDGASQVAGNSPVTNTNGTLTAFASIRTASPKELASIANGVMSSAVSDTTTASLANSLALRVGATTGGSIYQDMELLGVAVFRRALSADEIASIANYYGAS